MPPADFCNGYDPRAHLRTDQSPALLATASRRATGWRDLLRSLPTELSQARGHRTNPISPHRDDRSPRWLYPDLFDPDTSCRKLVPHRAWKPALRGDRAVRWFRTSSPNGPRRSTTRLEGPPSTPTRESERIWQNPRCLPPPSLSKIRQGAVSSSDCSERPRRLAAFLTLAPTDPDRTEWRVGSTP